MKTVFGVIRLLYIRERMHSIGGGEPERTCLYTRCVSVLVIEEQ